MCVDRLLEEVHVHKWRICGYVQDLEYCTCSRSSNGWCFMFFFDFSFGYPDATYLERVQQELAALGVTEKSIAEHGSDKK